MTDTPLFHAKPLLTEERALKFLETVHPMGGNEDNYGATQCKNDEQAEGVKLAFKILGVPEGDIRHFKHAGFNQVTFDTGPLANEEIANNIKQHLRNARQQGLGQAIG